MHGLALAANLLDIRLIQWRLVDAKIGKVVREDAAAAVAQVMSATAAAAVVVLLLVLLRVGVVVVTLRGRRCTARGGRVRATAGAGLAVRVLDAEKR